MVFRVSEGDTNYSVSERVLSSTTGYIHNTFLKRFPTTPKSLNYL